MKGTNTYMIDYIDIAKYIAYQLQSGFNQNIKTEYVNQHINSLSEYPASLRNILFYVACISGMFLILISILKILNALDGPPTYLLIGLTFIFAVSTVITYQTESKKFNKIGRAHV